MGERLHVNAPKGTLTPELRSQITQRKAELIKFLRDQTFPASFVSPPIPRRVSKDPVSLSFAQERLWFLEQLEPGSAVYNICRASRLTGQLSITALEASFTEILRRHEILRSQIGIADGRPVLVTAALSKFEVPVIDLRSLADTERDREVRDRIKAEAEQQFDFSASLLLRIVVLQISNDQHILVLTTHHIVSDAWSMGILARELWTLYDAYANGRPSPLQDLPVQYPDYAFWQREWLQGEVLERLLSYWKQQLGNNLPVLDLGTDHPRPVVQRFRGARLSVTLEESLTKALAELSHCEGVTLFMTLLSAFQTLLHRYTGQEDIVVGSPIANRGRTEVEDLIGFFVNTLALRTDLSGKPTFRELLFRVRDVCFGAYAHQDLPFEKLVEELQPERDLSRNPLFQVMFLLQNAPSHIPKLAELTVGRIGVDTGTSKFDLTLGLAERDEKLVGFFEYNADLFDRSTIERMVGHFKMLLRGIVANPDQPISTLPLLTEVERHQLLVDWNDTKTDYPKDTCVHELFETQVKRTPEAIAVQFERKRLTYRELNSRANQLAYYLCGLGVGPEKLVGICVERSLEMVIGLLGILKAGGAYVPLDPSYPRERLEFMVKDSQCSFLLTQQRIVEDGRWRMEDCDSRFSILDIQIKVVCLDTDWETIAGESEQNLHSETKADNLAYVIYTSGSTGQPKGVAIEHCNTVALLFWVKSVFEDTELAGVLASTSICFDLSIFELFVPLSWGGKVILAENALHLHSMTENNEVTLINTVPSVMTELLAMGRLPDSVRTINLAGEPLRSELVKQIYQSANVKKIYDLYGPSETTTYSTFTLRTAEGPPTIGRPIANTRIYVLDGNSQPVPIGVPGQLCIGGAGVARGYLNRPYLTTERFISSSLNANGGERIYRTGDLARYRPDGDIEFLGRTDNQVKIRGYRIELGEIETVLNQHPAVKGSLVVAVNDVSSDSENPKSKIENPKSLVAYCVTNTQKPSFTELRSFLQQKLPDYMIPSAFVMLEGLPLTPNGKIDRNALPPPVDTRPGLEETYVDPRTQVEELLAQIWGEILRIEAVGIHDDFFELGGHSLLAVQIISRVREAFDKDVPLSALFDMPTIAGLATTIEKTISGRSNDLPPIVRASRDGPLPLSLNQEHLWTVDQMIPGTLSFNMPYVYRLSGDLDVTALERASGETIRRHEALRTVFAEVDGRPVQIIKDVSMFQLPMEDLRGGPADHLSQQAAVLLLKERKQPFDLATGPLFRIKLLRLTDRESFLLVTMHHIISDHWSIRVFRRELISMYEAYSQGRDPPFGVQPIQSGDHAVWEKQLLENGLLDRQRDYWKQQLGGSLPELEFRKSSKRNNEPGFETSRHLIEVDEALFTCIKSLAARENCTPFMVVVAALSIVIWVLTGQQDIRIGTLVANRRWRETENVIGHFVNTVILCTRPSPELNYRQLLKQVREITLAAYAQQELPFEHMARVLETEKKIKRGSLFQVLLSYQNFDFQSVNLPGLTFAPLGWQLPMSDSEETLTACDLIVNIRETSTKLTGSVNYRTDSVDSNFIVSMVERLATVLKQMTVEK